MHTVDVLVFGNILFNLKVQLLSPMGDLLEGESLGKETKTGAGWLASSATVEGKELSLELSNKSKCRTIARDHDPEQERLEPDMSPMKTIISNCFELKSWMVINALQHQ